LRELTSNKTPKAKANNSELFEANA